MARTTSPSVSVARRGSAASEPERAVLRLRGEHDISTRVSVAVGIARAANLDATLVVVDLRAVTFMDASTIGAIVTSRNRLEARGQSLELRAPSPSVRRILELCGLAHLVQQESVQSTGPAVALASWVDVPPTGSAERVAHEEGRTAGRPTTREPARLRVAASAHVEEEAATVDVHRAVP
jgi:anti-anti-sigma factor